MHSLAVKIVSLTALFLITFIAGILPLKLQRSSNTNGSLRDSRRKQLISLGTCFAGGAFFASSMLDLLPVVERDFKALFHAAGISTDYPIAPFGVSVGFFLILIVEQIIHVVKEGSANGHGHSHGDSSKAPLLENGQPSNYDHKNKSRRKSQRPVERDSGESDNDEPHEHSLSSIDLDHNHHHHIQDSEGDSEKDDHDHGHSIFADKSQKHHNERHYLRSYLLLIALSIHALFEGLAVGLFQNLDNMIQLLGALIIHKCIMAFSIGINLVQHSFPSSMVARSSFLFSAMSPIGFGIGILMLTYTTTTMGRILSSIFQAIATGTFLYVTFFEIFFHELNSTECPKLLKVMMMILGYSLIAILQYFESSIK